LGELRRRAGANLKVEMTFDPGELGHVNVLDRLKGNYIQVPALDSTYADRLSLWQHRVIRRYAQRELTERTDILALAQAKAEIRALVDRDFHHKSTRGRKRHARFLFESAPAPAAPETRGNTTANRTVREQKSPIPGSGSPARSNFFSDDDVLPVFETNLDLPNSSALSVNSQSDVSASEEGRIL
jgi:putative transposase